MVLPYIYLHTHTRSYRRESEDDRHTHMLNLDLTCAQTHTHSSGRFSYSTPRSASWHTHTNSCILVICLMMTHPYPRLVALQNTYFSFTFTGTFLLHACGVTRNWRTYFISVRRVFLVETVVLQTVLWDIRAWNARFLVVIVSQSLLIDSLDWKLCGHYLVAISYINFLLHFWIIQRNTLGS